MGGLVAGCGDDDGGGSSGGSSGSTETGSTEGAKVIDPASMEGAKGEVTYCQGKDTPGDAKASIGAFNAKFESQGLTAKLVEFPADARQQRNQFVQRQEAKSGECDVFSADVIWTAEFAAQGWLYDMTPYIEARKDEFIPATLETVTYDGKNWGAPDSVGRGVPLLPHGRRSEVAGDVAGGLRGRRQEGRHRLPGRGLRGPDLRLPRDRVRGRRQGAVRRRQEGGVRLAREPQGAPVHGRRHQGRRGAEGRHDVHGGAGAPLLRGRARDVHAQLAVRVRAPARRTRTRRKFDVAPFPTFEGGGKAGILGGHNDVISVYSKNPGGALALVDYRTGEEDQIRKISRVLAAGALRAAWDDPKVKKALPFADELKQAIEQAKARPVSPVYPQISEAIYKNVNEALSGAVSPEEAIKTGQADMEKALATF